jgi:hypothetical protein
MSGALPAKRDDAAPLPPLYRQLIAGDVSIAELKSRKLPGKRREIVYAGEKNIHRHFRLLAGDFAGNAEICFAHAQLVVCIRRSLELAEVLPFFFKLWREEADFLAKHLDSRWLISACDTFADYGTPAQQAAAMPLILLVNITKLAETERRWLADADAVPEKIGAIAESHRRKMHIELWDGVTAYAPFCGDMPGNMFRRMMRILGEDAALSAIARELIRRVTAADTLLGRLARMNPDFLPLELRAPVESPPIAPA